MIVIIRDIDVPSFACAWFVWGTRLTRSINKAKAAIRDASPLLIVQSGIETNS